MIASTRWCRADEWRDAARTAVRWAAGPAAVRRRRTRRRCTQPSSDSSRIRAPAAPRWSAAPHRWRGRSPSRDGALQATSTARRACPSGRSRPRRWPPPQPHLGAADVLPQLAKRDTGNHGGERFGRDRCSSRAAASALRSGSSSRRRSCVQLCRRREDGAGRTAGAIALRRGRPGSVARPRLAEARRPASPSASRRRRRARHHHRRSRRRRCARHHHRRSRRRRRTGIAAGVFGGG